MRVQFHQLAAACAFLPIVQTVATPAHKTQRSLDDEPKNPYHISTPFYATLERLSRLVDITYCVGNTGVSKPFNCVSRCNEFPSVALTNTWNTGPLLSDSSGYIAVDHGTKQHPGEERYPLAKTKPAIIIAFRGTYSIANTIMDLSTVPQRYVPYPSPDNGGAEPPEKPEHECTNCTAHMGFLDSWRNAREHVIPQIQHLRTQYPSYPVQLVGHSLGGAVACLAALELKVSLGWDDVTVTTFGEPRVGNAGFVRYVDDVFQLSGREKLEERAYRRVTHKDDPVPLLPLGEWGYKSHAGEIYISKRELAPTEEDIYACVGDEDPRCIAQADSSMWAALRQLLSARDVIPKAENIPARFKLWQLFFAHRDYFWRLGLCVPGGDPANWGRGGGGGQSDEMNEL